jgi:sugar transferase EpsL
MSRFYREHGKRALDLLVSVPLLIALSPVLVLLAALVRVTMGKPVFFRQVRPGLGGHPFTIRKFRTMRPTTGHHGRPPVDQQRLTPVGGFLRRWSLDELPELTHVVAGEMSLVGPRPLLMEYLPLYTEEQARRHEVRPGLTGWAQVHGRNAVSWEERFVHDVWYVDHVSLAVDLRILMRTCALLFKREGISAEGHATMPLFTGSPAERIRR